MNFEDIFNEMFQEFNSFFNNHLQNHSGFSCMKCHGPVAPLTGGVCESCQLDEINMELGSIVQQLYGSDDALKSDIAMLALGGPPKGYNPFHCLN